MYQYIIPVIGIVAIILLLGVAGQPLADRGIAMLANLVSPVANLFSASVGGTGGFTIVSIDEVNVLINNQLNPNGFFRITAVANRGAETIIGTITPDNFFSETGVETDNSFNIRIDNLKETARYQVDNLNPNVDFWLQKYFDTSRECSRGNCCMNADWDCTGTHLCIVKVGDLVRADIDLKSVRSEATISAGVGFSSESISVSSDSPAGQFSFGNVIWTGGLSTGNIPPSANEFEVTYDRGSGFWRIVKKSDVQRVTYVNAKSSFQTELNLLCKETFANTNVIQNKINNFNVKYDAFKFQDRTINEGFIWENRNSESGVVNLNSLSPVEFFNPLLVFTVDAKTVGIQVNIGEPNILSANVPVFKSADLQGKININVQNVANAPGSFSAELKNCNQFSQVYSITGQQFAPFQSKTIVMPIRTLAAANEVTEVCTVEVCDQSGFGICDQELVTIHMLEAAFCTEGKTTIDGRCIDKCVNGQLERVECCTPDQIIGTNMLTGEFECQASDATSPFGLPSLEQILGMILIAAVIAIIIAALIAFLPLILPIAGLAFMGAFVRSRFIIVVIIIMIILLVLFLVPIASLAGQLAVFG